MLKKCYLDISEFSILFGFVFFKFFYPWFYSFKFALNIVASIAIYLLKAKRKKMLIYTMHSDALSATVIFLLVMFFAAVIRHWRWRLVLITMTPDYFLTWRMTESHVEMVEC